MRVSSIFDRKFEFSSDADERSADVCANYWGGIPCIFAELKPFCCYSDRVAFIAEKR
jgi:hypothetical protein